MTDLYDYHNGPNLGLEPTTPRQMRGADVAQPKRRPYNASGSLGEYGISPECDTAPAAQPAASDEHLIETGCYQTVIDRHSQPAANPEPSDEEIDSIAASMPDGAGGMLKQWGYRQFSRALLARYGQPAASAGPLTDTYVQTVPDKCDRIVWRGSYYHLPLRSVAQEPATNADARDAARWRHVERIARKNTAYDRYGDGAHWSVGVFSDDSRQTFGETIDAAMRKEGRGDE